MLAQVNENAIGEQPWLNANQAQCFGLLSFTDHGKAVSRLLIKSGCTRIVLGDSDEKSLDDLKAECTKSAGSDVQIVSRKCDTSIPSELDQLIAAAVDRFCRIDHCANCEGTSMIQGKTADISVSDFKQPGEAWQRRVSVIHQ